MNNYSFFGRICIIKKETVIGILCAVPFVCLASYFWINARNMPGVSFEWYWSGDLIYKFGFPLTAIVLYFPTYAGRYLTPDDHWWAIPLLNLLFIIQWVLWTHLISYLIHKK